MRRKSNRGELTLATAIIGAWVLAVLAGGVTHVVLRSKYDREKRKAALQPVASPTPDSEALPADPE